MPKRTLSPSTTDESTGEPEENTSEFGVFDGASSIISLGLDDSDRNLASESVQMTTLQSASSEERGDPGVVGVQRARRVSWPCSSTQAVVAAAAVFQGMLILITLTAINKYGLFDGSSSGDNNDLEQVKYYDKPDIQQPERSGAEDYDDGPGALERMQGRAMASGGSALALATPDLGADADTVNRAGDASQTAHSPSSAGRNTSGRVLMCLFADSFEGDFPAQLCTHLVFMNAVIDLQAQLIRPNSAEQGRAVLQRFINQRRELEDGGSRFLVSLWEARVTDTYRDLFTDWSRGTRAATLALGWLQRTGLDGLALLNLAVSADSGPDFLSIFKVLRTVMGRDVTLVFGFYLAGIPEGKEETRLVRTLHQIAKFVNFTVFETHDPRPVSCKVFVPNAYQKRADDLDAPGNTIIAAPAEVPFHVRTRLESFRGPRYGRHVELKKRVAGFVTKQRNHLKAADVELIRLKTSDISRHMGIPRAKFKASQSQSLKWSAGASELYQLLKGRLCVSLTLATFRFIVHAGPGHLGARCYNYYPASIRQHCREKRLVHYAEAAIGNYAEVPAGTQLQSARLEAFDTVTTLRKKLSLILDDYPAVCVALYHADLEDYGGVCDPGEPFARITAAKQILDSKPPV